MKAWQRCHYPSSVDVEGKKGDISTSNMPNGQTSKGVKGCVYRNRKEETRSERVSFPHSLHLPLIPTQQSIARHPILSIQEYPKYIENGTENDTHHFIGIFAFILYFFTSYPLTSSQLIRSQMSATYVYNTSSEAKEPKDMIRRSEYSQLRNSMSPTFLPVVYRTCERGLTFESE